MGQNVSATKTTIKLNPRINLLGNRASVGVIFIVYGLQKFDPVWRQHLINFELPPELQIPIALARTIGGILLTVGFMTRITGVIFRIILLDAIFRN